MGSSYLLPHGLDQPVADASTVVRFPSMGKYWLFIRTKDCEPWRAPGQLGCIQLLINDKPVVETFGTKGPDWFKYDGGTVEITKKRTNLILHDLAGFEGRCDVILFTKGLSYQLPNNLPPMNQ